MLSILRKFKDEINRWHSSIQIDSDHWYIFGSLIIYYSSHYIDLLTDKRCTHNSNIYIEKDSKYVFFGSIFILTIQLNQRSYGKESFCQKCLFSFSDLQMFSERQCRPQKQLGRQKFSWPSVGLGQHYMPTSLFLDSEGRRRYRKSSN